MGGKATKKHEGRAGDKGLSKGASAGGDDASAVLEGGVMERLTLSMTDAKIICRSRARADYTLSVCEYLAEHASAYVYA